MTLHDKIMQIYPSLTWQDFSCFDGTIEIQNDGEKDYIKSWTNSNPQLTAAQLDAIN